METYSGYKNRETWACNLWLSNDQGFYETIHENIRDLTKRSYIDADSLRYDFRSWLENWVTDELKQFANESKAGSEIRNMFNDIGSLWRIDWDEIAREWLAENDDYAQWVKELEEIQ